MNCTCERCNARREIERAGLPPDHDCPVCYEKLPGDGSPCTSAECRALRARTAPAPKEEPKPENAPSVVADPAQERRGRAARWRNRPGPKCKADLFTEGTDPTRVCCRECGLPVVRGQVYRRGVEGYPDDLCMTRRGVMCGVAHERCVRLLSEGLDPRAAAPQEAT